MDSKPKKGITRHKLGKRCLLSMQLSGVLNSQLENPALERTWSHNYVLEYRPLGLV